MIDGYTVVLSNNCPPQLLQVVTMRTRKVRLTRSVLTSKHWIWDITVSMFVVVLVQYVNLWGHLQNVQLDMCMPNKFIWKWTSSQQYMAASMYRMFFQGVVQGQGAAKLQVLLVSPPRSLLDIRSVSAP
jgi:hypothetical protein